MLPTSLLYEIDKTETFAIRNEVPMVVINAYRELIDKIKELYEKNIEKADSIVELIKWSEKE